MRFQSTSELNGAPLSITRRSYKRLNADGLKQLKVLGEGLRKARQAMGLTQLQAAARAGMTRQKLIEVEQGRPGVAICSYVAALSVVNKEWALRDATTKAAGRIGVGTGV